MSAPVLSNETLTITPLTGNEKAGNHNYNAPSLNLKKAWPKKGHNFSMYFERRALTTDRWRFPLTLNILNPYRSLCSSLVPKKCECNIMSSSRHWAKSSWLDLIPTQSYWLLNEASRSGAGTHQSRRCYSICRSLRRDGQVGARSQQAGLLLQQLILAVFKSQSIHLYPRPCLLFCFFRTKMSKIQNN